MKNSLLDIKNSLRDILIRYGRVSLDASSAGDSDLFAAGLDSFGMVDVMMVVEEEFGVVFTPAALSRRSFATVNTLAAVIAGLQRPDGAEATPERTPQPVSDHPATR